MSRLSDALVDRDEKKMAFELAKHELLEAVMETVENAPDGIFARELAAEGEVPTCVVMGAIQSAMRQGMLDRHISKQTLTYVRLRDDGSIDLNDRIVRIYEANKYTIAHHNRRR